MQALPLPVTSIIISEAHHGWPDKEVDSKGYSNHCNKFPCNCFLPSDFDKRNILLHLHLDWNTYHQYDHHFQPNMLECM